MQGNTTEVIAWNKHSVRTTRTQEDSNILIEKQKTTKMLYSLSFCLTIHCWSFGTSLSKPSLFHHHSQNDYSKKRSIALLSLIQKELEQKSCCIKISKLQSFTFFSQTDGMLMQHNRRAGKEQVF